MPEHEASPKRLSAAQHACIDSQLPHVAAALRPGRTLSPDSCGWRVGSSLKLWRNGRWYDHKRGQGGRGAFSLIEHYLGHTADAVEWAVQWLAKHPEPGPFTGNDDSDEPSADEVERVTYITTLYQSGQSIENTPAWNYLCGRGIDPGKLPPTLVAAMRWLPNMRGEEGYLIFPFRDEAGTITALHITHITPQGYKSAIEPIRIINRGPADWSSTSLLSYDSGVGTEYVVAEGLEDFLSVVLAGCPRAAGVGNVSAFGRAKLPLTVETVVIARDGDDPLTKREADQALYRGIARYLGQKLAVRVTATPIGVDPNDLLRSAGVDGLRALIEMAQFKIGRFDPTSFREELYRLDALAWGWARKSASLLLEIPLEVLEKDRTAVRQMWAEQGAGIDATEVDEDQTPWPEPITDIGPVLDTALEQLEKHVVTSRTNLATVVMWAVHAHRIHQDKCAPTKAPRLAVQSPAKGSGKTTLLECLECLVPNAIMVGSITPASLFRAIETLNPTLLLDEADNVVTKNNNPDLLAILNSGHNKKGAYVIRNVPTEDGGWEPRKFSTFAPIALAGIKALPETLHDRSQVIMLKRALQGEQQQHLRDGDSPVLIECRRKIARWMQDLNEIPDPELPGELYNRTGDNWRPLFALANLAGGQWPDLVLRAALAAIGSARDPAELPRLLLSVRDIYAAKNVERLTTAELCHELNTEEEGGWSEISNARGVNDYWLREILKDVIPNTADWEKKRRWNVGGKKRRGYTLAHFQDAFERYLPGGGPRPADPSGPSGRGEENPEGSDASTDRMDRAGSKRGKNSSGPSGPTDGATGRMGQMDNGPDTIRPGSSGPGNEEFPRATRPHGPDGPDLNPENEVPAREDGPLRGARRRRSRTKPDSSDPTEAPSHPDHGAPQGRGGRRNP